MGSHKNQSFKAVSYLIAVIKFHTNETQLSVTAIMPKSKGKVKRGRTQDIQSIHSFIHPSIYVSIYPCLWTFTGSLASSFKKFAIVFSSLPCNRVALLSAHPQKLWIDCRANRWKIFYILIYYTLPQLLLVKILSMISRSVLLPYLYFKDSQSQNKWTEKERRINPWHVSHWIPLPCFLARSVVPLTLSWPGIPFLLFTFVPSTPQGLDELRMGFSFRGLHCILSNLIWQLQYTWWNFENSPNRKIVHWKAANANLMRIIKIRNRW